MLYCLKAKQFFKKKIKIFFFTNKSPKKDVAAGKVEKEKKKLEICPEMSLGRKIRKCALQHSDLPLDEGRFYYEFEFFFFKKIVK